MDYLGGYASKGLRAERLVKVALALVAVAALLGAIHYVFFRNWREELQAKRFLEMVQDREYEGAYAMWGCSVDEPCRYYPFDEFLEDWGPEAPFGEVTGYALGRSYTQPNGVVVRYTINGIERDPLFVERNPPKISFAPN
jgi:type II secretory pathway pseudopilin PulG